ncbi:MAG: MBL fold metallo-hydrolase [Bryobacteraceae bacterium]
MRRRVWLGGAGVLSAAGMGSAMYKISPAFWHQFAREMGRPIASVSHRPRTQHWSDRGLYATWLGHSSVLMKIDGFTVITDPVLNDRVGLSLGPLTLGIKRLTEPALAVRQLPHVDLILLSHAHMDHLDLPTIRALESRKTTVITAARTRDLLRYRRFREIRELGWGETVRVGPLQIRGCEVNHWGARMRTDVWRGYNGYLIEGDRHRVLFAGDTANTDAFRKLRTTRAIDLGIFPIGAYNPWVRFHCTPEQAWSMGNDARVERFIPVHHQTFLLGREPTLEPIERFLTAAGADSRRIVMQRIGQEVKV